MPDTLKTLATPKVFSCSSSSTKSLLAKQPPTKTLSLVWFCPETETHFSLSPSPFLLQDQHKARLVLNYLF
ncbi:hypothetical protein CICLE_v10023205mg [Citrus x clementina]|uniref:Uncharacterized protein n=1 Tax=Citrus clementina TaxID=85681 RepID=V4TV01_CITCL|nr:hypothetical protein CICLE_v10023205mg [Citrus x clementina]